MAIPYEREDGGIDSSIDFQDALLAVKVTKEGKYYIYWREDLTSEQRSWLSALVDNDFKARMN